ncbi:hypothetical protein H5410_040303 [Solanum commersonii]|uniref:Uncharacterized protein n=1 Tax=Solanum commersonii TaxID=4109 RepID=A0A9J5XPQ5_SOLCO|nr:hypothetical protein H5410_040303 [Solanum commersonii]
MAKKKAFTPLFYLASISLLEKFRELEELLFLDEMIKGYSKTHLKEFGIGIHKEMIQLIMIQNENRMDMILHFSTNIIWFGILSGYSILGKEKLVILNSWAQEFLYNLSDTKKSFVSSSSNRSFSRYHSPQLGIRYTLYL